MTFYKILDLSTWLSPLILITGIVIGLFSYKKLLPIHKSIMWYMAAMLCVDAVVRAMWLTGGNNLVILPAFSLIELIFFLFFYRKFFLTASRKPATALAILGIIYIIGEILFYFVFNEIEATQFQPYAKVVDNFVVIVFTLMFFYDRINQFADAQFLNVRFNIVMLVFFTLNLIFFLPFNFLINESTGLKFYFWLCNLFITLIFYLYLTWLIWKNGPTPNQFKP